MSATNVSNLVSASIRVCRVGHVEIGPEVDVGVYPYSEIPLDSNTAPKSDAVKSSLLTRRIVTTSLVLSSIQAFIFESHDSRDPPSSSEHVVWQSSSTPDDELCT